MHFIVRSFQRLQDVYYINTRQKKNNPFGFYLPLKHFFIYVAILLFLCSINLFAKYQTFLALKDGTVLEVTIINHYTKGKNSERFKLQDSQGNILYANYKGKFKNIIGKKARVYGKIYQCSFIRFLKSCNIYNSSLSLIPTHDSKRFFRDLITKQHENILASNLYSALFLADNLDRSLRQASTALGLAHLIAISGFHLAILSMFFYVCICPIYFFFHRYFCYRNAFYDLSFLSLVFIFFYLVLIDFEPSFLRAFIMACMSYFLFFCGFKIVSFYNLFLCVLIALAFNVSLIFHIGFLLSVAGVFCIFLFLQHIEILLFSWTRVQKIVFGALLFNCVIFLQMMPIVHYFFPYFSPYQLVSIPFSILFVMLFPLLILMHIFGYGALFDFAIEYVIQHSFLLSELWTPMWFLIVYIVILLFAMRSQFAYFCSLLMALLFYFMNLQIYRAAFNVF